MYHALGFPAQATCPPCSYLSEGSCLVCKDGDTHPGCAGCVGGRPAPRPWYVSDFFVAMTTAVVASVAVALIVPWITRQK